MDQEEFKEEEPQASQDEHMEDPKPQPATASRASAGGELQSN